MKCSPPRVQRKCEELVHFLQDINDPFENEDMFCKLSTNLRWNESKPNEKMSRAKIITRYLTGNSNIGCIEHVSSLIIRPSFIPCNFKLIFKLNACECLTIALKNISLTKIDISTFSKVFLCSESEQLFKAMFWYLFVCYFIPTSAAHEYHRHIRKILAQLLKNLSEMFLKFQYSSIIQQNILQYEKNQSQRNRTANIDDIRMESMNAKLMGNKKCSKIFYDYFFDSYAFALSEAMYISYIRYFTIDQWLIHYRIRHRIIDDIFYLLNGIHLSHISRTKQLNGIYPNGTLIPQPILWRDSTINIGLLCHTNKQKKRILSGKRSNLRTMSLYSPSSLSSSVTKRKIAKNFTSEINSSSSERKTFSKSLSKSKLNLEKNPNLIQLESYDELKRAKRKLSSSNSRTFTVNNYDMNSNPMSSKMIPLQTWLQKQIILGDKKQKNHPTRRKFFARQISPLLAMNVSKRGIKSGECWMYHHIQPCCKYGGSDTFQTYIDSQLLSRVENICEEYRNLNRKITHNLGLATHLKSMNIKKQHSSAHQKRIKVEKMFSSNIVDNLKQTQTLQKVL